jgi:hypothetical protein
MTENKIKNGVFSTREDELTIPLLVRGYQPNERGTSRNDILCLESRASPITPSPLRQILLKASGMEFKRPTQPCVFALQGAAIKEEQIIIRPPDWWHEFVQEGLMFRFK